MRDFVPGCCFTAELSCVKMAAGAEMEPYQYYSGERRELMNYNNTDL